MSYIQDNLMPNEKILFSARVHPAVFLPAIMAFVFGMGFFIYGVSTINSKDIAQSMFAWFYLLIFAMFFLLALKLGLEALIAMLTTEFAVTNRRVIAKTGFIHRRTLEMLLPKIESVAVYQHIIGRMLSFGSVTVTGTGGTKERFMAIAEPIAVRKKINQIIENYMQAYAEYQQQKALNPRAGG